jgi:hypothetical protein
MSLRDAIFFGDVSLVFAVTYSAPNVKHLFSGQDGGDVLFAFLGVFTCAFRLATFFNHVLNIVEVCSQEQMRRVAAPPVVAMVQYVHSIRDGASGQFPRKAMCSSGIAVNRQRSIAMTAHASSPIPAIGSTELIYSFPKAFLDRLARIVTADKTRLLTSRFRFLQTLTTATGAKIGGRWSKVIFVVSKHIENRMTLKPSTGAVGQVGNLGLFSTATHAQSTWIGRFYFVFLVLMSKNILKWLAFYPASSSVIVRGKIGFLSTSAVAVSVGDFLRSFFCGMIIHVETFLSMFGYSVGRSQRCHGLFIGSHSCNYTTNAQFTQLQSTWGFA